VIPASPSTGAPASQRTISPYPIHPQRDEPAREQAARQLNYLAHLVETGKLPATDLFEAIAAADIEQYARWLALRWVADVAQRHAREHGWISTLSQSTALPGDWLYGLITRTTPAALAEALHRAAGQRDAHDQETEEARAS
jgi:hypothetical protein